MGVLDGLDADGVFATGPTAGNVVGLIIGIEPDDVGSTFSTQS